MDTLHTSSDLGPRRVPEARTPQRVRHPLRRRIARVAAVEDISPRIRRITFQGDDLKGFTSAAADDHVKLFFPKPGQTVRELIALLEQDSPSLPRDDRPPARDYTPSRFDADTGELEIEFVLHGDGPASTWAAQAQPGQSLGIGGPKGSFIIPDDYGLYVLIGDETALPAIARRLREMTPLTRVAAFIEVEDKREIRPLPTAADATIRWLPRDGAAAGQADILVRALRTFALPKDIPIRDIHVWIGAEIEVARHIRTYLMEEDAIPRAQIRAAGYWRRGVADGAARIEE